MADERIPRLLTIPARVRFLSVEPMLGPINFAAHFRASAQWRTLPNGDKTGPWYGLNQLIFGGESGPGARPCNVEWIRDGVQQCRAAGVKAFVKQLGAKPYFIAATAPSAGPMDLNLDDKKGGDMAEWPADLRVREFPDFTTARVSV